MHKYFFYFTDLTPLDLTSVWQEKKEKSLQNQALILCSFFTDSPLCLLLNYVYMCIRKKRIHLPCDWI